MPRPIVLLRLALLLFAAIALVRPAGGQPDDFGVIEDAERVERAFQAVLERVAPSVVGIRVQRRYLAEIPHPDRDDDDERRRYAQLVSVNGSGAVIDADGLILTNEHVIQSAATIEVVLHDGRPLPATLVASDPRSDLAVLRIAHGGLAPVRFCDWPRVTRGQWSLALGNPFGLASDGEPSVSVGVISNLGRRLPGLGEADDRLYHDMLQTTAPIHPGNSGGPLFNIRGEMIGVITAMHVRGAEEGAGFAIPMNPRRREIVRRLTAGDTIEYGFAGIGVRAARPDERAVAGVPGPGGVVVQNLTPEGPAARAGVQVGDVLVSLDAEPISDEGAFVEQIGAQPVGRSVALEVRRRGEPIETRLTIARRAVTRVGWMRGEAVLWRGLRLGQSPERWEPGDQARGLVVLDVDQRAAEAGLQPGDVVIAVAGRPVQDIEQFRREIDARRHEVVRLTVGDGRAVAVRP